MKIKFIQFFFFIFIAYGNLFAYPDCSSILTISKFELLTKNEKLKTIHPYLLEAFCNSEKKDEFVELYLNTFTNVSAKKQRLNELSYLLHKLILRDNTKLFLDFFDKLLIHIKNRYPELTSSLQYKNLSFTYFNHTKGSFFACNYLNDTGTNFNTDLPINISSYNHFIKLSKCAKDADNFNVSVFYLMKALQISKQLNYPNSRLKSGHVYKSIAMCYYDLKDYKNAKKYADSTINTFLPEFKQKIGLGVGYEYKALSVYQLEHDINEAQSLFKNAQNIYQEVDNISRFHFVERLKAEVYLKEKPNVATQHLFNYVDYFYENERKIHYTPGWLIAHKILQTHQIKNLTLSNNRRITHQQVIDSLSVFLPKEKLKNQLIISSALIKYYSSNFDRDSLYKYNKLQNKFEAQRNEISIINRQNSVDLYLKNYKKEQDLIKLNLINQEKSYQNRLLIGVISFVLIILTFYYFYKRKQKQMILTRLQLKEAEHNKLKTEQSLKEEKLRRKEQDEKLLKLAYDNEIKRKELLQLKLNKKQKEFESAELDKEKKQKLLDEVFNTLKDKNVEDINSLIVKLKTNNIITRQNGSLKKLFESISPKFMAAIKDINSNLTENDLLYCILIKNNHDTKQIALYLNISPKSVNQHKYRLKKKLNIPKNQVITDFLKNII